MMKTSTMYHLAQLAVLGCGAIDPESKLAILSVLMDDEETAKWVERQEAQVQE